MPLIFALIVEFVIGVLGTICSSDLGGEVRVERIH